MQLSPPAERPSNDLLARARCGDQEAWQALFNECYPKILRVVHRRISSRMRRFYDSTDIANEVMKSLAAKFDRFDFSSVDGLRAFLIHAAEQKVIDGHRRGHAQKRDVGRDRPMGGGGDGAVAWELVDGSPTASQVAVATEEEELLLGGQSGEQREVLALKLQGFTNSEVARETGWNLRRVERFLGRLRGTCRLG